MGMTADQMKLIGAMMGMIKLGKSVYQQAAFDIINMLDELSRDDDFTSFCLGEVMPVLEVHSSDDYGIIAVYDDDHILEFIV